MYCARCGQEGDWLDHCDSRRGDTEVYFGFKPGELCQGCYRDLVNEPQIFDTDLRHFNFEYYYSASSGRSREILKNQKENNVLVSYATRLNGRVGTESQHWVDCGGDPQAFNTEEFIKNGGYPTPSEEYLNYVEKVTEGKQDKWTLRDYPCAKSVLDNHDATIREFQQKTAEAHKELLEKAKSRNIKAQPVCVIQGQEIKDYLRHINILNNHNALTDYVCIGSIAAYGPQRQQQIILTIRSFLPERFDIHGLGVNIATLREKDVLDALRSADTGYWMERGGGKESPWRWNSDIQLNINKATKEYLDHRLSLNKLLLDHEWKLDTPVTNKERTAGLSEFTDSNPDPKGKISPHSFKEHLNQDSLRALESISFNGMKRSTTENDNPQTKMNKHLNKADTTTAQETLPLTD